MRTGLVNLRQGPANGVRRIASKSPIIGGSPIAAAC
jgi:hypothetical protein